MTFDANGGGGSDPVSTTVTETVASGSTVSRPATNPAKPNHGFSDWYTEAAGTTAYNFDTPVTGNITLYAGYAVDKRMVNFTLTGGSTFPDDSGQASYARVDYGSTVPEPVTPSRYGFTFTGWYTDAAATDLYDFNTPVIEDLNLILQSPYHLIAEAREGDDAEDIVIVSDSVTQCCRIVIAMMARASGSAVNFTQDNDATILSYSNFVRDLEFKLNGAIGATAAFFGELCQYVSENASRLIKDDNDAALIRNIFESFFGRLDVVRLKNDMNIS